VTVIHLKYKPNISAFVGWTAPAGAAIPIAGDWVEEAGRTYNVMGRIIRDQGREVTLIVRPSDVNVSY